MIVVSHCRGKFIEKMIECFVLNDVKRAEKERKEEINYCTRFICEKDILSDLSGRRGVSDEHSFGNKNKFELRKTKKREIEVDFNQHVADYGV